MNIDNYNVFNNLKRASEVSLLGVRLRQAREDISLTQKDVAKFLCLKLSVIKSIEDGCLDHLEISEIFVYGYVRSYARLVGVDSETMIMPLIHELNFKSSVEEEKKIKILHIWNYFKEKVGLVISGVIFFSCILIISCIIYYLNNLKWFSSKGRNYNVTCSNSMHFVTGEYDKNDLIFFLKDKCLKNKSNGFLSSPFCYYTDYMISTSYFIFDFSKKFNKFLNKVNYYSTNSIYENGIFDFFYNLNILNNICDVNDDYMLVMQFTSDCWVEILDCSGKKLYVGTQHSGNVLNLKGQIPYRLTIGVPHAVQIKYRGNVVSLKKFIYPYKVAHITIPD